MSEHTDATTTETSPRITGAPWITLVDIDGYGVPDCERYTPTCPPDDDEESDPATWPAWTDGWIWVADDDGPTEEDWLEYRRHFDELDAREELRAFEERCNPMWGYE